MRERASLPLRQGHVDGEVVVLEHARLVTRTPKPTVRGDCHTVCHPRDVPGNQSTRGHRTPTPPLADCRSPTSPATTVCAWSPRSLSLSPSLSPPAEIPGGSCASPRTALFPERTGYEGGSGYSVGPYGKQLRGALPTTRTRTRTESDGDKAGER